MSAESNQDSTGGVFTVSITGDGVNVEKQIDAERAMEIIALTVGASAPTGPSKTSEPPARRGGKRRPRGSSTASSANVTRRQRRAGGPSVVKDLSLRPKGKKAFADFAKEKQPSSHQQKQLVAVYWLAKEAGVTSGITVDHINTCYQGAGWKRPTNLGNALAVTSMRKGWLDTSDGSDIRLTVPGEDFVVHELPPQKTK